VDRTPRSQEWKEEVGKVTRNLQKFIALLAPVLVLALAAAGRIWGG
jgi:hypothetical protein